MIIGEDEKSTDKAGGGGGSTAETWHAEMSPLQEEWTNSEVFTEV